MPVGPPDRTEYLDTLEHAQGTGDLQPFQLFMHRRLTHIMSDYIGHVRDAVRVKEERDGAAKEGEEPRPAMTAAQMAHIAGLRNQGRG